MEDWQLSQNQKGQSRDTVSTHTFNDEQRFITNKSESDINVVQENSASLCWRCWEVTAACDNGKVMVMMNMFWHTEYKVWKRMSMMYQRHHQTMCFMFFSVWRHDIMIALRNIEKLDMVLSPPSFTLLNFGAEVLLVCTFSEQVMFLQPLVKHAHVSTLSKDMQVFSIRNVTETYFLKEIKKTI